MTHKDIIPPFAEETFLPEEINIHQLLAQFKLLVPTAFVQLGEIDYLCSTNPKWTKPVCERYSFTCGEELLFLDIPRTLMEKLELEKDIPYPVYLLPEVLKRKVNCGGITLENENEIFIQKPLTIQNVKKELKKWLDEVNGLRHQTNQLTNDDQLNRQTITNLQVEVAQLEKQKQDLTTELKGEKQLGQSQKSTCHTKIQSLQSKLQEKENRIIELEREKAELEDDLRNKQQELGEKDREVIGLNSELIKEKNWWDKWINEDGEILFDKDIYEWLWDNKKGELGDINSPHRKDYYTYWSTYGHDPIINQLVGGMNYRSQRFDKIWGDLKKNRLLVKFIFEYLREKNNW